MEAQLASVYTDFDGIARLKAKARQDESAALDEAAGQFEALFLQMMLKSMRQASQGEGLFDNDQSRLYRDMFDKQLSLHLSEHGGIGIREVIKRQLGGAANDVAPRDLADYRLRAIRPAAKAGAPDTTSQAAAEEPPRAKLDGSPQGFVEALWPYAQKAASALGLAPEALLAQAALETGWGKHVLQLADGSPTHNLFNIKADPRWDGGRASVSTLEFRDGVAVRERAQFRAYTDWQHSFDDYVAFVKNSPRYRQAVANSHDPATYFEALQRGGYATDPDYAQKINRLLGSREYQQAVEQQRQSPKPAEAI